MKGYLLSLPERLVRSTLGLGAGVRQEAGALQPAMLPSRDEISSMWSRLKAESARQERSVFETSSLIAISAVRAGVVRSGAMIGAAMFDHYERTLAEMRQVGFAAFAARQFRPYVRAAVDQFSPKRRTLTERMLGNFRHVQSPAD